MKKNKFFFHEEPPQGHDQKVMATVQDSLKRNQRMNDADGVLKGWKIWTAGFSTAAVIGLISYLMLRRQSQESSELVAFADLDLETEDVDLLAQDIDILEHLEILEEMGDES